MERRNFHRASLQYVLLLQEVQERKKFEFVETLLGFMYSWLTFYHSGYEVSEEFKPYMQELQQKIQKTRENFDCTHNEAEVLMHKMMEKPQERKSTACMEGYLYALEKRAIGSVWVKYYCQYIRESKAFIMRGYTQALTKVTTTDTLSVTTCTRRMTESIEKRFCFDITVRERPNVITLQAISENERNLWMEAMGGKEPVYCNPNVSKSDDSLLNDVGFNFIRKCIEAIESRGLEDQGLYRVVGVSSKVQKLTSLCLDRRKGASVNLSNSGEFEIKTITSALKNYFRNLPEPLMTFRLHYKFTAAAKKESKTLRFNDVHKLVHELPESNFEMLAILMKHLHKVSELHEKNKMTVSNLGVCFGPTLMRPEEETMAAIMDIKFSNIVVEILIANYEKIFKSSPDEKDVTFVNKSALSQGSPRPHTGSLPSQPSATFQDQQSDFRKTAKSLPPTSESPRRQEGSNSLQSELLNEIDSQLQERGLFVKSPIIPQNKGGRPKPMYSDDPLYSSSSSTESISSRSSLSTHSSNSSPPSNKKSSNSLSTVFWRSIQMRKYPKYHTYHGKQKDKTRYRNAQLIKLLKGENEFNEKGGSSQDQPPQSPVAEKRSPRSKRSSCEIVRLDSVPSEKTLRKRRTSSQPPLATTDETALHPPASNLVGVRPFSSTLSFWKKQQRETQDLQQVRTKGQGGGGITNFGNGSTSTSGSSTNASVGGSPSMPPSSKPASGNPSPLSNRDGRFPHPRSNTNPVALRGNATNRNRSAPCDCLRRQTHWGRCVRTLYACEAENESELSFNPNQVIFNVHSSKEPGWLLGTTENGRTGLIPENYVQDFVASDIAFVPPDKNIHQEKSPHTPKGTKI
ncbi:rho GTPase-activating protein 26-like isoform X6 [Anneissia japonica]|uniref:rho GTPase-activating protein 26-like isoform X6 n=1 Tax=Anneissia japonica TaxID=1529436 RepID=UPI001425A40B|nr:rho GTPase-activating protein 26-like isoform X6 [Anneissia japonica]